MEALGPLRVLVSNSAATVEVVGLFGGFSRTGEFFNVQTDTLDMHIRWQQLAAVFAVEKPGHMGGVDTSSFQFYDRAGAAAFSSVAWCWASSQAGTAFSINRLPWVVRRNGWARASFSVTTSSQPCVRIRFGRS